MWTPQPSRAQATYPKVDTTRLSRKWRGHLYQEEMGSACDPSSGLQPATGLSPLLGEFRMNTALHPAEQPDGVKGDTSVEATWCTMDSREGVRAWTVWSASLGSRPRSVTQPAGPGGHYISLCLMFASLKTELLHRPHLPGQL